MSLEEGLDASSQRGEIDKALCHGLFNKWHAPQMFFYGISKPFHFTICYKHNIMLVICAISIEVLLEMESLITFGGSKPNRS